MKLVRYAERPELIDLRGVLRQTFPEYMSHNEPGPKYWGRLYEEFGEFQLCLLDGGDPVAEVHSIPIAWDGSLDDLPAGWDEAFVRGVEARAEPTTLCALVLSIDPARRGEHLSSFMLNALRDAARGAGLTGLLAPIRPTRKERYPLIPIERYMTWRRDDGRPFDPWQRLHERVGGTTLAAAPRSMTIEAPVADWEEWTGMEFPDDGEYVFPGALATLVVTGGAGRHVEPNIWMLHSL